MIELAKLSYATFLIKYIVFNNSKIFYINLLEKLVPNALKQVTLSEITISLFLYIFPFF